MTAADADRVRGEILERWERGAVGWRKRADAVRTFGMPVSVWMIEQLHLQPGQRVLELAAGPGDTGFLATELIQPGGTLISSDASEAMLEVARDRAREQGVENVEFKQLQLEWIDLDAASVDAILCRWGLMFAPDPGAALQEMRRVLRPGGRVALAAWDEPERNPWATIPTRALMELGHVEPPDPNAPGMFVFAKPGRLQELLENAGFTEVMVEALPVPREDSALELYLEETLDLSRPFADVRATLSDEEWGRVEAKIAELAAPFAGPGGKLRFPASTLVAAATA